MSGKVVRHAVRRGLLIAGFAIAFAPASAEARKHAALVVDGNTGRIISETAADEPRYPASLTKMMTLYVVFDLIEQKKLTFDTRITFTETATRVQPTKLGIPVGGSITVLEAAKALITKSANDASVALAEHIAGSEPRFAALMTQTARRIGMKASTFKNAHGLPDSEQVTTARDMITLGLRLQDDFPKYYGLFSLREFTHRGESHRNHNTMLLTYEGTDGIKTGYIGSSGFNLVANVKRGDKHVIGVVFGGASAGARNTTMKTLLNMALFKASSTKTRQAVPIVRAKPTAPPPQVAVAVPQPVAVVRPSPPARAAVAMPALVQTTQATITAPTTIAAAATNDVPVAKVRPLLVAPRPPQQVALPTPAPAQVIAPPPMAWTFAPAAPPQQRPATPPTQVAALPAPSGAHRLNGPQPGGIQIQVGAFATKAEADRHLAQVQSRTGTILGTVTPSTQQAVNNGATVFRARFTNVDPAQAGNLCNALRRQQIDCLVTKAE